MATRFSSLTLELKLFMSILPLGLPGLQPMMMEVSAGHAESGITRGAQADGPGLLIDYGWKSVTVCDCVSTMTLQGRAHTLFS